MISEPTVSAIGRLRFAFFSSAFMLVATIQPSYAKALATTAVKSACPELVIRSTAEEKF